MKQARPFLLLGIFLCLGVVFWFYFKDQALEAYHDYFNKENSSSPSRAKGPKPDLTIINLPLDIKGSGNALTVELDLDKDSKVKVYKPCIVKFLIRDSKNKLLKTETGELGIKQSLDIPSNGESSVTAKVEDYAGDIIARRTVAYKDGNPTNLASSNEAPKILAVSSFLDFTGTPPEHTLVTIAARDRIVADLVQNYDCQVISRSNGLALSSENTLNRLNAADNGKILSTIPAADYSVMGYFSRGEVLANGNIDNFKCNLFATDLKNDQTEEVSERKVFIAEYRNGYSDDISPVVSGKLRLRPKTTSFSMTDKPLDETWAVMPLIKLVSADGNAEAKTDSDLAMKLELALQESGKIKRIVDHSEIEKLLQEHKVSMSDGISESTAAGIARILGADRVLTGQISKYKYRNDSRFRVDVFLVDGRNAVVLDASSAICKPGCLEQTVLALTRPFVSRRYAETKFNAQAREMRIKEAEIYKEFLKGLQQHGNKGFLAARQGVSLAEAASMLVKDDPVKAYELAYVFIFEVMDQYKKNMTRDQKIKSLKIVETLLSRCKHAKRTKTPLVYMALACNMAEEYDKAISYIDRHFQKNPSLDKRYPSYAKALTYFGMEDYDNAIKFVKECDNIVCGACLACRIYREVGDEKKEYENLCKLNLNDSDYVLGEFPLRRLMLTCKLKGPQAALDYSKKLHSWSLIRPDIQIELAKYHIALGDKISAAVIIENIDSDKVISKNGVDIKKVKSDIAKIKKQLKGVKVPWKKAVEAKNCQNKEYCIYIQPLGDVDMDIVNKAIPLIEDFTGFKVKTLPQLPLPDDPASYNKKRGQYNTEYVLDRIARTIEYPENAILFENVTNEDIYSEGLRFVFSTTQKWKGNITSYSRWQGRPKREYAEMLAKSISSDLIGESFMANASNNIEHIKWGRRCKNVSCIMSGSSSAWGMLRKKFAMCPECQKEYAKVDFEKVHFFTQNKKKHLNSGNDLKARRIQQYREKVEKYSREQKK